MVFWLREKNKGDFGETQVFSPLVHQIAISPNCIENLDIFSVAIPITLLSLSCKVGSTNLSLIFFLVSFFSPFFLSFSFFLYWFVLFLFFFPLIMSFFFLDVINFLPLFLNSFSTCSVSKYQSPFVYYHSIIILLSPYSFIYLWISPKILTLSLQIILFEHFQIYMSMGINLKWKLGNKLS